LKNNITFFQTCSFLAKWGNNPPRIRQFLKIFWNREIQGIPDIEYKFGIFFSFSRLSGHAKFVQMSDINIFFGV